MAKKLFVVRRTDTFHMDGTWRKTSGDDVVIFTKRHKAEKYISEEMASVMASDAGRGDIEAVIHSQTTYVVVRKDGTIETTRYMLNQVKPGVELLGD